MIVDGVEFKQEQRDVWFRIQCIDHGNFPDLMLSRYDIWWEMHVHDANTGEVIATERRTTKEGCVAWARQHGYISEEE